MERYTQDMKDIEFTQEQQITSQQLGIYNTRQIIMTKKKKLKETAKRCRNLRSNDRLQRKHYGTERFQCQNFKIDLKQKI